MNPAELIKERDALRAENGKQRAEIERLENLTASGVHSCSIYCQRPMCVLRREREEQRKLAGDYCASWVKARDENDTLRARVAEQDRIIDELQNAELKRTAERVQAEQRVAELESLLASEKATRNAIIAKGLAAEQRNAELEAALREVLDSPESTISGPLYTRAEQILARAESAAPAKHPDTEIVEAINSAGSHWDISHNWNGWTVWVGDCYTGKSCCDPTDLRSAIRAAVAFDAARKQGGPTP